MIRNKTLDLYEAVLTYDSENTPSRHGESSCRYRWGRSCDDGGVLFLTGGWSYGKLPA
jgi:hypothetical protein